MNSQPNKPLSIAVLRTRNGEIPGFEDFYLLTCRNTMNDIKSSVPDKDQAVKIFRRVYCEIWKKRDSLPEAGIVRPWIRVIIRDAAKKTAGVNIEEFAAELDNDVLSDADDQISSELIVIEEKLGLLMLPDSITGRKSRGSMAGSLVKFLFSLAIVGLAVFTAGFLIRSLRMSSGPAKESQAASGVIAVDSETEEVTEAADIEGWNETKNGRRYRMENGSYKESEWFEDEDALYWFDEAGYAITGTKQFSNQNFVFDKDGALKLISRSYAMEKNETVLSVQMKQFDHGEDAENIVDNSITIDGNWIYYLYLDRDAGELPVLLRVTRGKDNTELIAENVTGYTVQQKYVWYCSDNQISRFEKGEEGSQVGEGYSVQEEDDAWYLKDNYGRNATGTGGYVSMNGRIYRVEDGRIKYVRPDTQKIGSYAFRCENAGKSPVILLGDGKEYLRQGTAIDAVAALGETLYYSVLITDAENPVSQIWKIDVYEGTAIPIGGSFEGRILSMYPYPEDDAIYMEYRPRSGSFYGRIAAVRNGEAQILDDTEARAGTFGNGNDLLQPVWSADGSLYCYWENCGSHAASDGTLQVLDTKTVMIPESGGKTLGTGNASAPQAAFFGQSDNTEENTEPETVEPMSEFSEDEMIEENRTAEAVPSEASGTTAGTAEMKPGEAVGTAGGPGESTGQENKPAEPVQSTQSSGPGGGSTETVPAAPQVQPAGGTSATVAPIPGP